MAVHLYIKMHAQSISKKMAFVFFEIHNSFWCFKHMSDLHEYFSIR